MYYSTTGYSSARGLYKSILMNSQIVQKGKKWKNKKGIEIWEVLRRILWEQGKALQQQLSGTYR